MTTMFADRSGKSVSALATLGRAILLVGLVPAGSDAAAVENDMQEWIDSRIASGDNLAISAVVIDKGNTAFYFGGAVEPGGRRPDATTQFQIGSITKAFTNLLLAEMVAAGKLGYDTTIGEILGEAFVPANPAVPAITVEQLATHTSGLPRLPANLVPEDPLDPYKGYDETALREALRSTRDRQPLGHHYAYSNFGVGLLGHLLGELDDSSYHRALIEYVVEPLGLEQTGFRESANVARGFRGGEVVPAWSMDDALAGAGALWGSASDFSKLAAVLLGADDWPLRHRLDDDLQVVETGSDGLSVTRVWHVAGDENLPVFWHNGGTGGFWSFFGFRPDHGRAVAILVAGEVDPTDRGLAWLGAGEREPSPVPVDAAILGQYELSPQIGIGVYELDNALVAQVSGQAPLPLHGVSDDWYAFGLVDASVRFLRQDGQVVRLELAQDGRIQAAAKVSDTARTAERQAVELDVGSLEDYVGRYEINAGASFTIQTRDGGLEAKLTGQPFFPIFPLGEDRFFYRIVDAELQFERGDDGTVTALVLHQGSIVQRATKR